MSKKLQNPMTSVIPGLLCLGLSVQLIVLPSANAQQATNVAAAGQGPVKLEKSVITGSLIPTAETVGPAPVAVISAVELERRDVRAVEQLAKILPSAIGAG